MNVMPKMYILFPKIKEEKILTQGPLEKIEIIRKDIQLENSNIINSNVKLYNIVTYLLVSQEAQFMVVPPYLWRLNSKTPR